MRDIGEALIHLVGGAVVFWLFLMAFLIFVAALVVGAIYRVWLLVS